MRIDNSQIKKDIMVATTNAVAKIAAVVAGLGLVAMSFASFAPSAKALTSSEIAAQIAALQAELAALGGSSSSTTFGVDLTIGSTGSDVTALQNWLISKGYSIPAGATGYFGAQTQAALAAYQAANGIAPAAGHFGPITRAKVNAAGPSNDDDSDDSDDSDEDLSGGAGSVDEYKLVSGLDNEEVGEDEEDVEVAGLEIEADTGSDLEFTAVKLVFDESTGATSDFEDYATEVSVWFDGEEVARLDADEFTDDNDWTQTVSLDGAVLDAGETGELTVAVSGISNLDSTDATDMWTVDFRQVRFEDADGATISEDPGTAVRTFSFETFANSSDVELKISDDDDEINDARTIEVDATDDTDNVDALSFTLEAEGDSDIDFKDFGVNVDVTGALHADDVLVDLTLWIDGEEVGSADSFDDVDGVDVGTDEDYHFDDLDYTLGAGDTVSAMITADFLSIADDLDEGDTIEFTLGETETDQATLVQVEDESGEDLADGSITGSASSGAFELRSIGIMVTFVSASETVTANDNAVDNDLGTFVVVFNAEAFGDTIYVSKTATATTATSIVDTSITTGTLFLVEDSGTATTDDLQDLVTFSTSGGASDGTNNLVLQDGEDSDVTLTVTQTNDSAEDDGLYRMLLKSVGWALTDTTTWNVYDFNLEDFKTDPVSLN
jgi:peptidoglycan hydrolase-like protein with peptidoglycan-binding domain